MIEALLGQEPSWTKTLDSDGGATVLEGPVVALGPTMKEYRFRIAIDVPREFPSPDAHPKARLLESPFEPHLNGHVFSSRTLCVQMEPAHEIDYAKVGLVGFFRQVEIHLHRFRIWALTRKYPGPEYAHGPGGVEQFGDELRATLPMALRRFVRPGIPYPPDSQWCPCGADGRFRHCHKAALKALRARFIAAGARPRSWSSLRTKLPVARAARDQQDKTD